MPPPGGRTAPAIVHHFVKPAVIQGPVVTDVRSAVNGALALLHSIETLDAAYDAWAEIREAQRQSEREFANEEGRLADQGALLLGALQSAGAGNGGVAALAHQPETHTMFVEAERALKQSQAALKAEHQAVDGLFGQALAGIREETQKRVAARNALATPGLKLMVRTLPQDQRILHCERPSADLAVALQYALSGRIPTRHDFLFDDSVDDVQRDPPALYADEGVAAAQSRGAPVEVTQVLAGRGDVWPVRGALMYQMGEGGPWVRWRPRGPVLECELADGAAWRNVLKTSEAEQITGYLLGLKLKGLLKLELVRG